MVAHNGFQTDGQGEELYRRAEVAQSIQNVLASYGIGNFHCTGYDQHGILQEFNSGNASGEAAHAVQSSNRSTGDTIEDAHFNSSSNCYDSSDEEPVVQQPAVRPSMKNRNRRQGRSMLPRDASRYATAPYPLPASCPQSDLDDDPLPTKNQAKCFEIRDTAKVTSFLLERLKRMQQLTDKKIAKAWIKGICPRKQAKFPYHTNRKDLSPEGKEKPVLPGWWPDAAVCRFIEPDHIRRDERMKLCLHLLRLRPTPERLRQWNQDKSEPHPTHLTRGWTAFLQELAGPEIFEDLPKEDKKRTQQKQTLMMQMYEIAQLEEDYLRGGLDPEYMYSYEEDEEEPKPSTSKRARPSSVTSNAPTRSRDTSVARNPTKSKKVRRASISGAPNVVQARPDVEMLDHASSYGRTATNTYGDSNPSRETHALKTPVIDMAVRQPRHSNSLAGPCGSVPIKRASSMASNATDQTVQWDGPVGKWIDHTSWSFGSTSDSFAQSHYEYPQRIVDGHDHDYSAAMQHQNIVQVHQVNHIPEPQFQAVPNTPIYPTSVNLGYMHQLPPQAAYSTLVPSSQYILPTHSDPSVGEIHPPMAMPQTYQNGLAERHIAPMQTHGLPQSRGGAGWEQGSLYHHHYSS